MLGRRHSRIRRRGSSNIEEKENADFVNCTKANHQSNIMHSMMVEEAAGKLPFYTQSCGQQHHQEIKSENQQIICQHPLYKSIQCSSLKKSPEKQSKRYHLLMRQPSLEDASMDKWFGHCTPEQLHNLKLVQDYSVAILTHYIQSCQPNFSFMENHSISESLRAKMVDWIVQVLSAQKMSEQSFFRAIAYMDLFMKRSDKRLQDKDIHLLGICCMMLAVKQEEVYPIKLKTMCEKVARGKFKKRHIEQQQVKLLENIGWRLEVVTIYDILKLLLTRVFGIEISNKNNSGQNSMRLKTTSSRTLKYLHSVCLYLAKMSRYSYRLSQTPTPLMTAAVIYVGIKTTEQIVNDLDPDQYLQQICTLLGCLQSSQVISLSQQLLDLAKKFTQTFPGLDNLNRFNKIPQIDRNLQEEQTKNKQCSPIKRQHCAIMNDD